MVEVNQKIPDRDEAPLRPAVHGGEPSAVSRVFDKRPRFAGLALDTAPGSRGRGVPKIAERVLDNADDLIHGLCSRATESNLYTSWSEGIGPFHGEAGLADLGRIRWGDAGELRSHVVDDVEIAVWAVVVA